jgi:deazaflavin-dependent oxidoreductase (nitroreductase family)
VEWRGASWWQSNGVTEASDTDASDTDASDTDAAPAGFRARRSYQQGRWRRLENAVMSALVSAGLVPHSYLLTTRGCRTGRQRRNPVLVVEHDGRRWLVAPYGAVSWVHNARAAGQVQLARRRESDAYAIREVDGQEAGPVLRRYVQIASATRQYFQAEQNDPVESFIAEARLHPVFEITPIAPDSPTLSREGPGPK